MGAGNWGLGWAGLGQGAIDGRAGGEPDARELELQFLQLFFMVFYCVSYPVDSLGVSVRGKTQSVPFGKGMLEKNLIPLEEEPQNIYLAWTILQGGVLTHFGFTGCFCEETHPELSQLREYQLQGPFSWQRNPTFWVHAC